MLSFFKKEKIHCIVVNHPAPKEIPQSRYSEYDAQIRSVVEPFGFEFKNYSHDHQLDSRNHFYDHHHLNEAGAAIFNQILIKYLRQKSLL